MNRYGLADRFPELAARARRSGRPISVLRHTAAVLGDHLRPFELAYRIGGDEFVVVLPDVGLDDAVQVADRLCRAGAARRGGAWRSP